MTKLANLKIQCEQCGEKLAHEVTTKQERNWIANIQIHEKCKRWDYDKVEYRFFEHHILQVYIKNSEIVNLIIHGKVKTDIPDDQLIKLKKEYKSFSWDEMSNNYDLYCMYVRALVHLTSEDLMNEMRSYVGAE